MDNGTVLLIEDNADLNSANRRALQMKRYSVRVAATLAEAREWLKEAEPDVILLDVMLPDGDGFGFCREIRARTQAHILFLTAKAEHEDIVAGLAAGGDDYITKPFHAQELLARVEAAMRRREIGIPLRTVAKGRLELNLASDRALLDGNDLMLSPMEFNVLCLLAQNEGKVLGLEDIYKQAWGRPSNDEKNTVQVTVSRLRRKLAPSGYGISAVRRRGYVFEATRAAPSLSPRNLKV